MINFTKNTYVINLLTGIIFILLNYGCSPISDEAIPAPLEIVSREKNIILDYRGAGYKVEVQGHEAAEDFEWIISDPSIITTVFGNIIALNSGVASVVITYPFETDYVVTINVTVNHDSQIELTSKQKTGIYKNIKSAIEYSENIISIETALDFILGNNDFENKWGTLIHSLLVEKSDPYPNFDQVNTYIPQMTVNIIQLSKHDKISLRKTSIRALFHISKSFFSQESDQCKEQIYNLYSSLSDNIREEIAYALRYYKNSSQNFEDLIRISSTYRYDEQEDVRKELVSSLSYFHKEFHSEYPDLQLFLYQTYLLLIKDSAGNISALALDNLAALVQQWHNFTPDYLSSRWSDLMKQAEYGSTIKYDKARQNSAQLLNKLVVCKNIDFQNKALDLIHYLTKDPIEAVRYESLLSLIKYYKKGLDEIKPLAFEYILSMQSDDSKRIKEKLIPYLNE